MTDTELPLMAARRRADFDTLYAAAKADPKGWYATNKTDAQKGFERPLVRLITRNHPEIFEAADRNVVTSGDMFLSKLGRGMPFQNAAAGIDKAALIAFLERIIPVLKFLAPLAGPYAPAVLAAVVVLQLIVERYHANNPTVGLDINDL